MSVAIATEWLPAETLQPAETPTAITFLTEARIQAIRAKLASCDPQALASFAPVRKAADAALERDAQLPAEGEWKIPGFYQDKDDHQNKKAPLLHDANDAYAMALMFRLTGQKRYADQVARFAMGWTSVRRLSPEADSPLTFSYHFPALIFAADLVRPSKAWGDLEEQRFTAYLKHIRKEYHRTQGCRWKVWSSENNWGNWGLVLGMSAAAFLGDELWFAELVQRWKELIEIQIDASGHLPLEVTRNHGTGTHGIWYSHFSLQPQTIAAEIARVNGICLYDYISPSGRTLHQAYEAVIPWVEDPKTFPYFKGKNTDDLHRVDAISYFEILNSRWPNETAQRLINANRPLSSIHSSPFSTLTHGGLSPDL